MAENEGGPTVDRGGAPEPSQENPDRDQTGIGGDAAVKSEPPAPDDCSAIDLESARDRAS